MNDRVGGGAVEEADFGDLSQALRELAGEAREGVERLAERLELERRMQETPMVVLGVAAAAGFVLGGGLWPVLRPFVKAAARTALSPANLLAIGAAVGALRAAGARAEGDRDESAPVPETH
ncbi:MAG: hypothetical protein QM767_20210 [Anaeromyxobacter sp.]